MVELKLSETGSEAEESEFSENEEIANTSGGDDVSTGGVEHAPQDHGVTDNGIFSKKRIKTRAMKTVMESKRVIRQRMSRIMLSLFLGEVPLVWYKDEEHIGYDITGKKIKKKERQDKLDSFLASADDSKNWRKIYDEYNDEEVELTPHETKLIRKLLKGQAPHANFDPYAPYVDWFAWEDSKHPLSSAPEPKRRFIPSKWETKKVVQYVRAIRKGLIKFDKPKEEPRVYHLWGDDSSSKEKAAHGLAYIPAPKPKLPGHDESYNPSLEYIPTQEEINSYQLMFEEDRPKFIPKRFTSLRSVPAYEKAVSESFERCLDLYLCPRARKKRINIDPESLKPKLPSRKNLKPYPTTCYLEYRGHKGAVLSISTEASGEWIASGSSDGTVRVWEVETGRCLRIWELGEAVQHVIRHLSWAGHKMLDMRELAILIHQLSKKVTQRIPFKLHGLPVSSTFHPTRSVFFVSTKKNVRVYDLLKQKLVKKLETGFREVSSIAIHPGGDNVIVGSRDGKMAWFDMDLSSQPYRVLKCHPKDITSVAFHRSYPLFASCSDDCTAYVFHGMVYSDLNQNPLIVPLEILRGHTSANGRGVMDCKFHPRQPWLFTAGADSVIRLFCH
ncbi:hypothetical protein C3L33_18511, partial [Rhododendron williamsianum]